MLRFIRFDKENTRAERAQTDKAAPKQDIWIMLNKNLEKDYNLYECITIDEQLFPFRGHTKFTQYIPEVESSRTSLASRTHFEVLGLGLEALGPRKLPCPRLEDSTIF